MAKELESAIIKTPYKKMSYTEKQIIEIARCADPVTGAQYFMDNYFFIQHPTKGAIQYHPFEYQERLIDTYHNYRFSISLMPRQTGKSTSAAPFLMRNKLISWVRPGVLETKASRVCPTRVLMALDFPELERPAKAISAPSGGGRPLGWATEISNVA